MSYGKMNGILLPGNSLKFPLVRVIVSKIAYKSLITTKNIHLLRTDYRNVVHENFFRDFGADQGYSSHQLLSDLDTYKR